jgi:CubicO group peptidase (beta-lactamase class C family)
MLGFRAFPLLLVTCLVAVADAAANCAILGPAFPKPRNPSADPGVKAAVANLTAIFQGLATGNAVPATNVSWSIEVYSANEPGLIFKHYHTQSNLKTLNNSGVSEVDTNTVYRLGSLTKVFTVLTWLANDGDIKWTTPITEYVPELKEIQAQQARDEVWNIDWDEITVGALMSQMSGIPRDCELLQGKGGNEEYRPNRRRCPLGRAYSGLQEQRAGVRWISRVITGRHTSMRPMATM